MSKKNKKTYMLTPAWQDTTVPGITQAVERLVKQIDSVHDTKNQKETAPRLSKSEKARATQTYKLGEQARGQALNYMYTFAEKGDMNNRDLVAVADMKALNRYFAKVAAGRSSNDAGRGRICFSSLEQYQAFKKMLSNLDENGYVKDINIKNVRVLKHETDDYIENPRKSGFAGYIKTALEIEVGKGNIAYFEVQMMPENYLKADKDSHKLYDMMRILEEIPKIYLQDGDQDVYDALKLANEALFIEEGLRMQSSGQKITKSQAKRSANGELIGALLNATGSRPKTLLDMRKKPFDLPSREQVEDTTNILSQISEQIRMLPGRSLPWREQTIDALAFAKTSIYNLDKARRVIEAKRNNGWSLEQSKDIVSEAHEHLPRR